jgi:hypothetical protein
MFTSAPEAGLTWDEAQERAVDLVDAEVVDSDHEYEVHDRRYEDNHELDDDRRRGITDTVDDKPDTASALAQHWNRAVELTWGGL